MGLFAPIIGLLSGNSAANKLSAGYNSAMNGILGATGNAQAGIQGAVNGAYQQLPAAQQSSVAGLNDTVSNANSILQTLWGGQTNNLAPYQAGGQQGLSQLAQYSASPDSKFQFNVNDYFNSPAYQFQLDQGKNAIENTLSASGMANSGAAAKKLEDYGQGLASQYYNQAFQQAQGTFQTNQNAQLANNSTLMNAGQNANQMYNQATQNYGNQAAGNTMTAGEFGAQSNLSVAQMLAQMGFQGALDSGMLGMQGANSAGNFAIGSASAQAGKSLNQGNQLAGGMGNLASLLMMFGGG